MVMFDAAMPVLASVNAKLMPILMTATDDASKYEITVNKESGWDIGTFLEQLGHHVSAWAGPIMVILGFAALIAGAYMLVTGLISHGKKQTSWPIVILLFVVGGALAVGGWQFVAGHLAAGLSDTVENWGTGSGASSAASTTKFILPLLGL